MSSSQTGALTGTTITVIWALTCLFLGLVSFYANKPQAQTRFEKRMTTLTDDCHHYLELTSPPIKRFGGIGQKKLQGGIQQLSGLLLQIIHSSAFAKDGDKQANEAREKLKSRHSINKWPFLHLAAVLDSRNNPELLGLVNACDSELREEAEESLDDVVAWVVPLCAAGSVDLAVGKMKRECHAMMVAACIRSKAWTATSVRIPNALVGYFLVCLQHPY
jgi:hypothetical protein